MIHVSATATVNKIITVAIWLFFVSQALLSVRPVPRDGGVVQPASFVKVATGTWQRGGRCSLALAAKVRGCIVVGGGGSAGGCGRSASRWPVPERIRGHCLAAVDGGIEVGGSGQSGRGCLRRVGQRPPRFASPHCGCYSGPVGVRSLPSIGLVSACVSGHA